MGTYRDVPEPEFDRLAKPKGIQSWKRTNMISTTKVEFHDDIPYKPRKVNPEWAQMERARLKVTKAFLAHPESIGTKYAEVWKAVSAAAAVKVYGAMVTSAFRPLPTDSYRWLLARRGRFIYGSLIPRREIDWTPEMKAFYVAHSEGRAAPKRGYDYAIPQDEVDAVEFLEVDPEEIIQGLNWNQRNRYQKAREREQHDNDKG